MAWTRRKCFKERKSVFVLRKWRLNVLSWLKARLIWICRSIVRCAIALCFIGSRDFKPSGSGDENGVGALKSGCEEDYTINHV